MTGKHEDDKCYFCGGNLYSDKVTIPFTVDETIVVVKQVPAIVCRQCGEAIPDSDVASTIDQALKQARQVGFEVSVIEYEHLQLSPVAVAV